MKEGQKLVILSLLYCYTYSANIHFSVDASLFSLNRNRSASTRLSSIDVDVDVNVNVNRNSLPTCRRRSFLSQLLTIPRGGESDDSSTISTTSSNDSSVSSTIELIELDENEDENADENEDENEDGGESESAVALATDEVVQVTSEGEGNKEKEINLVFTTSKAGDGSESDPDGLPSRFLRMQKGNRVKAKAAFITTTKWREEEQVNTILGRPYPKFDLCKRIFPVYIPGRDLSNHIIVVQRVGMIDFDVAHHNNATGDDLLMHYVYVCEYCWNILEPGPPDGVMTTVMDLKNVHFSTFRDAEIRNFMKKFVKMMSDHYPQRSHKTLIINAPTWANMAFKVVKPLLRESTKKKITLLNGGKAQDKALIEILGKDSVPKELLADPESIEVGDSEDGGIEGFKSGISLIEDGMRLFVSYDTCS